MQVYYTKILQTWNKKEVSVKVLLPKMMGMKKEEEKPQGSTVGKILKSYI